MPKFTAIPEVMTISKGISEEITILKRSLKKLVTIGMFSPFPHFFSLLYNEV